MAILAIDQGGTKTALLLGDAFGNISAVGYGEGACHFLVGIPRAMSCIEQAFQQALEASGRIDADIEQVSAGLSGANWQDEVEALEGALNGRFHVKNAKVTNDCVVALYGGTNAGNAVVLCSGSGFNAAVRAEGKLTWVYNNYIEAFDAGGSGIAQRALVAVFRTDTQMGPPTSLTQRALEFFNYPDVLSLLLDYDRGRMRQPVKDFAYCVDEEAMKGDQVALSVQYEFGKSVSRYVIAAMKKYHLYGKPMDVVLSGGAFKAKSQVLVDAVKSAIHKESPLAQVINARYEPVVGAYLMALEARYGWPLDQALLDRVEDSASAHDLLRIKHEDGDEQ